LIVMSNLRQRLLALGVLAIALGARPAFADEPPLDDASRAAVRDLGYAGMDDYDAGRYPEAIDKLERAYQVLKAPALALWSARALTKVGRLVEASERYLDATRSPSVGEAEVQERARREAESERVELDKRIPHVVFRIQNAGGSPVMLTVDGKAVPSALLTAPRRVDPGVHAIVARRGADVVEAKVEIGEREERAIDLVFPVRVESPASKAPNAEPRAPATDPRKTLAVVSWIVGGVGLAGALVAGGLALGEKSDLEAECPSRRCLPAQHDAVDRYDLLKTLSTIGFVTAGVGAGTGTVLWMTAPTQARAPSTGLVIGISGAL
jgi:hypothetical protein